MSKKEEFAEIYDLLKQVAEYRKQPILDSEIREITKRVFEYRKGPELYSAIMAISTAKYFPSGTDIERQVREAKGLKPLKGLTPDLIDKFEEECVVSGQSVKNAKAGAEIARRTLRKEGTTVNIDFFTGENPGQVVTPLRDSVEVKDPFAELENFDKDTKNVLDALEEF